MKAVLFDFYHTLVVERQDTGFYEMVSRFLDIEISEFLSAYRPLGDATMSGKLKTMADRVYAACLSCGYVRDRALVESVVESAMPAFYRSISLYPDSLTVLAELRRMGLALGIVSNASSYSWPVIRQFSFDTHVDSIILSCDQGVMKPHPSIYQTACQALGVSAKDCIFVGDGGHDELVGARLIGMRTVLVDRNLPHTARARAHSDYCVRSLLEVTHLLSNATEMAEIEG